MHTHSNDLDVVVVLRCHISINNMVRKGLSFEGAASGQPEGKGSQLPSRLPPPRSPFLNWHRSASKTPRRVNTAGLPVSFQQPAKHRLGQGVLQMADSRLICCPICTA